MKRLIIIAFLLFSCSEKQQEIVEIRETNDSLFFKVNQKSTNWYFKSSSKNDTIFVDDENVTIIFDTTGQKIDSCAAIYRSYYY